MTEQADHAFGTGAQTMTVKARLFVEGKESDTAATAVIVGAAAGERSQQAEGTKGTVTVEGRGVLALGASHAGAFVAVFFSAR